MYSSPTVLAPLVALLYEDDTDILTLCLLCIREVALAWSRSVRSHPQSVAPPRIPVVRLAQITAEASVPNASAAALVLASLPTSGWTEVSLSGVIESIPSLFEPGSFREGEEFGFRQGLGIDPSMVGVFDGPILLLKKALMDSATDFETVLATEWPQRLLLALATILDPPAPTEGDDLQVIPASQRGLVCTADIYPTIILQVFMLSPTGLADAMMLLALMLGRDGLGWVDIVPVIGRLLEPNHLQFLQTWSDLTPGHPLRHAHELTAAAARLLLGGIRCKHKGVAQQFARAVQEQDVFAALLKACRLFSSVPAYLQVLIAASF